LITRKPSPVRPVEPNLNPTKKADKAILKLDWCSHAAMKYACEHWYYTRSVPNGKTVKIGAWERGEFVGCVVFGWGANSDLGKPYGLKMTECCELVRVAFRRHETSLTRILSLAISKFLIKQSPGLRLIISFADSTVHHGGIYQGMNWLYIGDTKSAAEYYYHGEWMHGRSVRQRWGTSVGIEGLEKVAGTVKHRYAYPLDEAMRDQLQSLAKPFPKKRLESVADDTPPCQPGNDGFESRIEASCATSRESAAPRDPAGRGSCKTIVALPPTPDPTIPGSDCQAPQTIPIALLAAQTEGGEHDAG
jgi:hypothetical protein